VPTLKWESNSNRVAVPSKAPRALVWKNLMASLGGQIDKDCADQSSFASQFASVVWAARAARRIDAECAAAGENAHAEVHAAGV